jgi:hypothetical protein
MWRLLEPLHAIVYFDPSARATYGEAGLRGYWMGYFASRSACLGPVSAEVVTAAFYNFHPRMVERAIPDAWSFSTPEKVLVARHRVVENAWSRVLGEADPGAIEAAATILLDALDAADVGGRVLYAGHRALEVPSSPHLRLWHAATLYREYRGDGHVAALVAHGCSGLDALHLAVASGAASRETTQPHRGWSDEEWEAGLRSAIDRGLLVGPTKLTDAGVQLKDRIEGLTDELSLPPWQGLDDDERRELDELLRPLASAVMDRQGIPFPNAMAFTRSRR